MKGTEYRDAVNAIDALFKLKYARSESATRTVGQVLTYLGARRIHAAIGNDPDAAADRRMLQMLSEVEDAAIRLNVIPQRNEHAVERRSAWQEVLTGLGLVKMLLERERDTITLAERLAKRDEVA